MKAICMVDTTVFVEILNVPNKASRPAEVLIQLEEKIKSKESLFLPMATVLETGNRVNRTVAGGSTFGLWISI